MCKRGERTKSCKELQNKVLRKCNFVFALVVGLAVITLICGIAGELTYAETVQRIKVYLYDYPGGLETLRYINNFLKNSRESVSGYIYTFSTVTAAVVVLYYTLQDNHREGIPHRKVVAYFVGSRTIALLFFLENIALIVLSFFSSNSAYIFLYGMMASIFILQASILIIIILSSSSGFCRWSVERTEYRQFKYLMKYTVTDRRYVWNYFVHHMPQVIAGDDMMFDKAILVKRLLNVPIDYCERSNYIGKMNSGEERKQKAMVYEFYFRNLLLSFEQLRELEEDCNQLFETIYEFVDKLNCRNVFLKEEDRLLVISAILNAAQVSNLPNGEAFCCHVLNECILNNAFRKKQFFLYLLFLDHLFRTEVEKVRMEELGTIKGMRNLRYAAENVYVEFWHIWATQSDIPLQNSIRYLDYALRGLEGKKGFSTVMDYYMYTIGR